MVDRNKKFVIQEHCSRGDVHWDLMLETVGNLQTYRLDKRPRELLTEKANAEKIFDHSKKFLTYQGPVNKGAGRVEIVEAGTYKIKGRQNDKIELSLQGDILKGDFALTLVDGQKWMFEHSN